MKVDAYIRSFASRYQHIYPISTLLYWINQLETNIFSELLAEYSTAYYKQTQYIDEFSLPTGVPFTAVYSVLVNGRQYDRFDGRSYRDLYSYMYYDSKVHLYPIPNETDTTVALSDLTFGTNTITSATGAFPGISAGDLVTISGCTVAGNNKTARVALVEEHKLTFPAATFTAQVEVAEITVCVPSIRVTYKTPLVVKTELNVSTDDLSIPESFYDLYDYHLMQRIAYHNSEMTESNNHAESFRVRYSDLREWWNNNRPISPKPRGKYHESSDFDKDID